MIEMTDAARDWLAKEGFDPAFGARPLRRTLQRQAVACAQLDEGLQFAGGLLLLQQHPAGERRHQADLGAPCRRCCSAYPAGTAKILWVGTVTIIFKKPVAKYSYRHVHSRL